jgi:hypothetical protein
MRAPLSRSRPTFFPGSAGAIRQAAPTVSRRRVTKRALPRSVSVMPKLMLVLLLTVVLGVAGAAAVSAASPAQVVHANQQAAATQAEELLGELVLPAGAAQAPTEPAGDGYQLAHAEELFFYAAQVERHEFWTTSASPNAVITSIEAHLPAGARSGGSGYSGTSVFVSYTLPAVDAPALGPRGLEVEAVALTGGGTGVRADATVRYAAPRLAAQRVPPQARVLDINVTGGPRATGSPYSSPPPLIVTNRRDIRRIAAIIDGLPFVALRGVAISCPFIPASPIVTFTFRAAAAGPVLAKVTLAADSPTDADPCFTATLRIRGHLEPGLLEGGRLLRRAGAILGVKLVSRALVPTAIR